MLEGGLTFSVARWSAWEPREGKLPRCSSYAEGEISTDELEKPDLSNVPAMQRRRLGRLARTVFQVLNHCSDTSKQEPVVFSSLMGEINRTQEILNSIAAGGAVSPASFSLSVHNAIGGLWSVIHGINAPILAVSPPANSPVPALLEAAGILQEGIYSAVNVVYYEEDYPEFYTPFIQGPSAPTALALRFVADDERTFSGTKFNLQRLPGNPSGTLGSWESYAALLRILTRRDTSSTVEEPQCSWQIKLCR
jgi:hypothetical protein